MNRHLASIGATGVVAIAGIVTGLAGASGQLQAGLFTLVLLGALATLSTQEEAVRR